MAKKITISLTTDSNTPTYGEIANAVRRSLTQTNVKDAPVHGSDTPFVSKGITVKTRDIAPKVKTYDPVREWAVENGYPEVAGKRGRLSRVIHEAYSEANK